VRRMYIRNVCGIFDVCSGITSAAKAAEFGLGTADTKSTHIDLATVLPIPTL
jgi:hypothetical protein